MTDPTSPPAHPLTRLTVDPLLRHALAEDLGLAGDITTQAVIPTSRTVEALVVARRAGVIAGLDLVRWTFDLLDPRVEVSSDVEDGARVVPGRPFARVKGPARAILTGERVALNLLGRLSGIATLTRAMVDAVASYPARIASTRKTTPGLRLLEQYAVRTGGGVNHRFGLYDGVMIKDNHLALAGGVRRAVAAARRPAGHMVKIEVEVETLAQLREAMAVGVDAVLLDNMDLPTLRRAVELVDHRAITEASGGVTLERLPAIAATGVDLISVGALTHSAPVLDIGLDITARPGTRRIR